VAGTPSYNDGTIGSSDSIGSDRYNYTGNVGSSRQGGSDPYHYKGTIGSTKNVGDDVYNKGKIGDKNALNGDSYNRGRYGSPVLPSPGSKPQALHTEFASDGNYSGSYHGDIVFYLQRAGGDGGGEGEQLVQDEGDFSYADDPVIGGVGGGYDIPQSSWNQGAMSGSSFSVPNDGGPSSPIPEVDQDPGVFTVNSSETVNLGDAIRNAFYTRDTFEEEEECRTRAASEYFFNNALNKAFNPDSTDDILESLERGSRADLAIELAKSTGFVTNTEDFINGINSGRIGFVTDATKVNNILVGKNNGRPIRSLR